MKMVGNDGQRAPSCDPAELEMSSSLLGRLCRTQHEARESMSVDDCHQKGNHGQTLQTTLPCESWKETHAS